MSMNNHETPQSIDFGVINELQWVSEFTNMKPTNNKDYLYMYSSDISLSLETIFHFKTVVNG